MPEANDPMSRLAYAVLQMDGIVNRLGLVTEGLCGPVLRGDKTEQPPKKRPDGVFEVVNHLAGELGDLVVRANDYLSRIEAYLPETGVRLQPSDD